MLLKHGKRVKLRHNESGITAEVTIVHADEKELSLHLSSGLKLSPGDEIELDVPGWESALYVFRASVIQVSGDKIYALLKGHHRLQRRQSQRIATRLEAQYLQLPKVDQESFHSGLIQDISCGGALLSVEDPLQLHSRVFIVFEIALGRGNAFSTGISSKVVREHPSPGKSKHSYGIAFDRPLALASV